MRALPAPCAATLMALRAFLALVLGCTLLSLAPVAAARSPQQAFVEIAVADLPREARDVLAAIRGGGPFRYERDGITFGNRERLLPSKPRGYYREYTVRTPGASNRGARRIVCGGAPTTPDACYYTADHYQSFLRIRE